ncbi:hypothetical protein C8Q75DRAFT_270268 [Abortiporus biennis]|nr:hypothetical protein C8Q75DRAFT_270268 [Abortiporus biennis]
MQRAHSSSTISSEYHSFSPPQYYPFPKTADHDVFFPSYSRVPAPATLMPTYYVQGHTPSTHHSRPRSHSVSYNGHRASQPIYRDYAMPQPQQIVYSSSNRSHVSHGSHGSHGSHHSHGHHGHQGHHHRSRRSSSATPSYRDSSRRHHSMSVSPQYYPTYSTPSHHHSSGRNTPVVVAPPPPQPYRNVLHKYSQPNTAYDTGHRSHSSHGFHIFGNAATSHPQSSSHSHRRYSEPSMGERIRRFFGIGEYNNNHRSRSASRGGFNFSDAARSNRAVDERGRPIYRV